MGRGKSGKVGSNVAALNSNSTSSSISERQSVRSLMRGVISQDPNSATRVEKNIQSYLNAANTGDSFSSTHDNEAQMSGERTEYTFTKQQDGSFNVERDERVYTGGGRTGFERHTYNDGNWSADRVAKQIRSDQPYSLAYYEKGSISGSYLIDLKRRRRYR